MNPLATLRNAARELLGAWARRRQGADELPLTLRGNRIYILPTRAGLAFAALLLLMLIAALNYANSMAMLLTFVLAGSALVGIHECHRNLKGLRLTVAQAIDSFAGSPGLIELGLDNTWPLTRAGLTLRCEAGSAQRIDIAPHAAQRMHLGYLRATRGRHRLGRIEISTTAPLGLFRAWSWLHLPLEAVVYPAPAGRLPLPTEGMQPQTQPRYGQPVGAEEWAALRPFAPGDSPRGVAWKLYARGAPLLVAQYEGTAGERHVLDFDATSGPLEARLSQLCEWILRCEQLREPYALRLPAQFIATGLGPAQQRAALRALALFGAAP